MKKRGVGERANILFDSIDLQIMELLKNNFLQVLEIAEKLKLRHKNLKPHIDKLLHLHLITFSIQNKKDIFLTSNLHAFEDVGGDEFGFFSKEELKNVKEDISFEEEVLRVLRKANTYYFNKESNKLLKLDYRRKGIEGNFNISKKKD